MAALAARTLLLYFFVNFIHGFNGIAMSISSCNTPHGLPGCIDEICEKKVCETNPECCETWDLNCAQIACHDPNSICQYIGTSCDDIPCHTAHTSNGCEPMQCSTSICEIKPDCCDNGWDSSCAQLACDPIHGLCNTIPNACDMINKPEAISFHSLASQSRHLLQTCSNDPCPGHQQRNTITCTCECPSTNSCPGNQIYSGVLCQCGCPTAPTCSTPQLFNVISCSCECPTVLSCGFGQQFDSDTCKCITPVTDCSMDPCPGYQMRNPLTCGCECPTAIQCTGNQEFNVFCECGCPVTPICRSPRQFNPIFCECECMPIMRQLCSAAHQFNEDTCGCESAVATTNAVTTTSAPLCSNDPCPGGIQQRNPTTCECECEIMTQCPGNQDFNILCECQCETTPYCKAKQQLNPISCGCECSQNSQTCDVHQIWNTDQCQCEDVSYTSSVIPQTTVAICPYASDPCPGHQVRAPATCDCGCESSVECPGNQEFNVFCECGCPATPICKAPQQFNVESCECECRSVAISACNDEQIFNTNTCVCETVPQVRATTISPTRNPTTALPTTANPTTMAPTLPKRIATVTPPTVSPITPSPTSMPTVPPIQTDAPSHTPSGHPSHDSSASPTNDPSLYPTDHPSNDPHTNTITKTMICELNYDLEDLEGYLEAEEIDIYEWADVVIKTLIHYDDSIVSESLRMHIVNVESADSIVIEYTLQMESIETFGIVLYHIDSTDVIIVNDDWRFPIVSNQVIMSSVENECAAIGQPCDDEVSCCDAMDIGSVLCIAESASNAHHGTCCIDYNNYGCSADSDCCYVNSYCAQQSGMCRRKPSKQRSGFKRYDASDSEDSVEDIDVNDTMQSRANAAVFMGKRIYDNGEYITEVPLRIGVDGIVLSASMKLLLCMVVVVIIGNVMCCLHEQWKKTKQEMKAKYLDEKCVKPPVDINIIK